MHLVVTTAFVSISLALALTPVKGHSIAFHVWEWFKNLFHKKSGSSKRTWFSVRTKKFEVIYSSQEAAVPQELVAPSAPSLLKQLPPALGGEWPTAPHVPANPEPALPLLPPQVTGPQLLDSNELPSRPTKPTVPEKKRRPRSGAGRGLTSGGYRSVSRGKNG